MIHGLSHMTFIVKDLERAATFWQAIFGAKEVYASGNKTYSLAQEMFFFVGDIWICIMQGDPPPQRSYNHVAFRIDESEFDAYITKIQRVGAEIKPGRARIEGEGCSIYFYDFDNHLFELHTGNLAARLRQYDQFS